MKKYIKAGLLVLLLVIPALIYLFLRSFGVNQYTLPVYHPIAIDSTAAISGKIPDTTYHTIPQFSLSTVKGMKVTSALLKDKIYIANFFSIPCLTTCPQLFSQLNRVQEIFSNNPEVFIVSHIIATDTTSKEVVQEFISANAVDSPRWLFLTGDTNELVELSRKGYFTSGIEDNQEKNRMVDSSNMEKLALVDKKGRIRGYYNGTDPEEVDRLLVEIKVLLAESN